MIPKNIDIELEMSGFGLESYRNTGDNYDNNDNYLIITDSDDKNSINFYEDLNQKNLVHTGNIFCCDSGKGTDTVKNLIKNWRGLFLNIMILTKPERLTNGSLNVDLNPPNFSLNDGDDSNIANNNNDNDDDNEKDNGNDIEDVEVKKQMTTNTLAMEFKILCDDTNRKKKEMSVMHQNNQGYDGVSSSDSRSTHSCDNSIGNIGKSCSNDSGDNNCVSSSDSRSDISSDSCDDNNDSLYHPIRCIIQVDTTDNDDNNNNRNNNDDNHDYNNNSKNIHNNYDETALMMAKALVPGSQSFVYIDLNSSYNDYSLLLSLLKNALVDNGIIAGSRDTIVKESK
jgi:hypothetical protein